MVTPSTTPYRPSPLSFGSPRSSPFRRPSAPPSPSTVIPPNTPGSSTGKIQTPTQSPSKLNRSHLAGDEETFAGTNEPILFPKPRESQSSPTRGANARGSFSSTLGSKVNERSKIDSDTLAKLPAAQLREMREAFQVLDRDNDGQVNGDDVADILRDLGQDSSPSAISPYFPPGKLQTLNLPTFLNNISTLLAPLSSPQELLNAFAAFDEDDSGQIDLAELRDALLHTTPDADESSLTEREIDQVVHGFTGRRVFGGKGMKSSGLGAAGKRAEVFQYQEFVGSIAGSTHTASNGQVETVKV